MSVEVRDIEKVVADAEPIINGIKDKYDGTEYYCDTELAGTIIMFIAHLKHTGGKLGGVNFQLLPFQVTFIVETLAVMQHKNGYRKHKEVIMFVSRKQGKTELLAAINLWMFFMDKEKQKEQYVIASDILQASILYAAIISMLKQTNWLEDLVQIFKAEKKIQTVDETFVDYFKVLSATAGTKDGLKGSLITSDETHSYPDSALFDVMSESMAHREQPLSIMISTAGYNKMGFFHRKLLYARQVMEGIIDDPSMFLMDFGLPDDADWEDEKNWIKCNPALGYGVKMDYLRDKFNKALHSASDEVSFRTKHLCQWVDSAKTWISSKDWKASHTKDFNEDDLIGRECYAGLDLSSTTDITSFVLVFPWDDGTGYDVITRSFIPKDTARVRSKEDRVSYLDWAKEGHMTLTEGNIIDYEDLYYHIMQDVAKFTILQIAFDRWNSTSLITKLMQEGVECVAVGQGFKTISPAVKAVESLVLTKKLNHDNNPILAWAISNVALETDAAENYKLSKEKAIERIDPAVALCMAVIRAESFREAEIDWDSLIG